MALKTSRCEQTAGSSTETPLCTFDHRLDLRTSSFTLWASEVRRYDALLAASLAEGVVSADPSQIRPPAKVSDSFAHAQATMKNAFARAQLATAQPASVRVATC